MNIIKSFSILIAFLLTGTLYGQSVNLEWVRHNAGAEGRIIADTITLDTNNNIYLAGTFEGDNGVTNIDFDPTDGIATVDSIGREDIYIQKLTSAGAFEWVKVVGGTQGDSVTSIQTDSDENLIIVGTFRDTVDFDPGAGTYELSSNGGDDIYVLKLKSNGDFLWAKSFGGSSYDNSPNVVLDAQDNIVASGAFEGTVDFDPDPGAAETYRLSSNGGDDIYVLKLNADGNFVWAKSFGGSSYEDSPNVVLDAQGNTVVSGTFSGTVDFDPDPSAAGTYSLSSKGNTDIYVLKLNTDGDFVWAKSFGGSSYEDNPKLVLDAQDNTVVSGSFSGTVDFDPDPSAAETYRLSSNGDYDVYVLKLNADGDFVWAKSFGGSGYEDNLNVVLDAEGNTVVSGTFEGTVDFDPGTGTHELSSNGSADVYILKLNADDGAFVWAKSFGGLSYESIPNVVLDAQENIVVFGTFGGTVDFDPQTDRTDDTFTTGVRSDDDGVTQRDTYILKYTQSTLDISNLAHQQNMIAYPNPSSGQITLDFGVVVDKVDIRVLNLFGQVVSEGAYNQVSQLPLAIAGAVGLYWVEVTIDGSKEVFSVIKK